MTVRWSVPASEDLKAIYDYTAEEHNVDAAAAEVAYLMAACERLGLFPQMGKADRAGGRELILPPFVISYRILDSVLSIDAIIHGARRF